MHALTIFLSAFLLFQIQPLIGKYILPWYGGTPAVWTTCMLFFQVMLLAGYSYAHLIALRLDRRRQGLLHAGLICGSLLFLPIIPEEIWKTVGSENPTWQILALLAVTIGAPYLILASTAPLLQHWYTRAHPGRSPFRLYALSNVGALLALFSFPFVFERWMQLQSLAWIWSTTYIVFALVCGYCAWRFALTEETSPTQRISAAEDASIAVAKPAWIDIGFWLSLSAFGSVMLLATTNRISQDVAAVPFLWVLPLSLYLLTFVICFDREAWYHRSLFSALLLVSILLVAAIMAASGWFSMTAQIAVYCFCLFVCCMCCHGELIRLKPDPYYLTLFYLCVAGGGAIGGIFVTLVAPVIFSGYWEYETGLVGCCLLMLMIRRRERFDAEQPLSSGTWWRGIARLGLTVVLGVIALRWTLDTTFNTDNGDLLIAERNFYGVLRLNYDDRDDPQLSRLTMSHGTTSHGFQYQAANKKHEPTMYYVRNSGVGLAIERHPNRLADNGNLRIGVIGLGVGTLSAYGRAGDTIEFFEINPDVVRLSREHFSFQQDAIDRGVQMDVQLGDARIVMEQQLREGVAERFDILAVDAFSSDAIPVHLLTRECFKMYLQHLKPDGVLAVHVSNKYLDLGPVVQKQAETHHKQLLRVIYQPDRTESVGAVADLSDWILLTENQQFLADQRVTSSAQSMSDSPVKGILWTDDFSNLFSVLR